MLKIFANPDHYFPENQSRLNDISKLIWDINLSNKGKVITSKHPLFIYEEDINQADICILTMLWNYYENHAKEKLAMLEIETAQKKSKPIVVFNTRDYRTIIPTNNLIVFESAGLKSKISYTYHSGLPFYIKDYLDLYSHGEIIFRKKQEKPIIGFCGQADVSFFQKIYRTSANNFHKIKFNIGLEKGEPPPFETTSFRGRVLQIFENSPLVKTNFEIKAKMRAGDPDIQSDHNENKLSFIKNLMDSDYTICMRGHGNFSIRFYETLCLGRIPVFIDTDCLLPFQDEIDYKSLFPWIEIENLQNAPEIVREFHERLTPGDFVDLQKACRKLWVDHMTPDGFHQDFYSKMIKLITPQ